MKRPCLPAVLISLLLVTTGGCMTDERYEIDLSDVKDFHWNGRLRVTRGFRGVFSGSRIRHVELFGDDGAAVSIDPNVSPPDVYLIGDRQRFQPAKITLRQTETFWRKQPETHVKPFWTREDLGGVVDECEPHQDKDK